MGEGEPAVGRESTIEQPSERSDDKSVDNSESDESGSGGEGLYDSGLSAPRGEVVQTDLDLDPPVPSLLAAARSEEVLPILQAGDQARVEDHQEGHERRQAVTATPGFNQKASKNRIGPNLAEELAVAFQRYRAWELGQ